MALRSTSSLTEMSTSNISWVLKAALRPSCADCLEVWEPEPPVTPWVCTGIALCYATILSCILVTRLLDRIKEFYVVYISGVQCMGHWTSQCDPLANFGKISYKYIMCVYKKLYTEMLMEKEQC